MAAFNMKGLASSINRQVQKVVDNRVEQMAERFIDLMQYEFLVYATNSGDTHHQAEAESVTYSIETTDTGRRIVFDMSDCDDYTKELWGYFTENVKPRLQE